MAASFERKMAGAMRLDAGVRKLAVIYNPNGYTAGVGTLPNAVVEAAGFDTLARRLGIAGTAVIPLETLLLARPDLVITSRPRADAPSLATDLLRHPALAHAFAGARTAIVPDRLWICGGPQIAEALARLGSARERLGR